MGTGNSSKLSVVPIWHDHIETLVASRSGDRDRTAIVEQFGLPLAVGALYGVVSGEQFSQIASGALATATGLLMAFMFQVTASMYDRSAALADSAPEPTKAVREHLELIHHLAANAGYACLVSLLTTATLIVSTLATGWVGTAASIVSVVLLVHLGLLMMLLLRRVHLLGRRHRIEVRTGALHDPD